MAETTGFDAFFAGSKAVDRAGRPLRLFHGTVADFTVFDRAEGSLEAYFGAGFYFTNSAADAASNYARTDGPDRAAKVDKIVEERLAQEAQYGSLDGSELDRDAIHAEVMAATAQNRGVTMPVFLSLKNPFVLGGGKETFLDFDDGFSGSGEFGVKTGPLQTFIESLKWVLEGYDASGEFDELLSDLQEDAVLESPGIAASKLLEELKNRLPVDLLDPNTGDVLREEIFRQTLERCGYDGIIDHDVFKRFGFRADAYGRKVSGMPGLTPDTTHFIAFKPEQVKSAIGNNGAYDTANADIRFSIAQENDADTETPSSAAVRDFTERVIAAQELADRVRSTGRRLVVRSDGMVRLYHSASAANARSIEGRGALTGNTWLSSSKGETLRQVKHKHGASTTTLSLAVDPRHIEFSTGTAEFYAPNGLVMSAAGIWTAPTMQADQAPSQNPSDLQMATSFRAWFGQSKTVNADGSPMVLYHGTRSDISTIELQRAQRLPGFWMTPQKSLATTYAGEGVVNASSYREGANVMPLYAKIERPRLYYPAKEPMQMAWADYMESDADGFFEMDDDGSVYAVTVKNGGQIKSALGNVGLFDPANQDIRFSQSAVSGVEPGGTVARAYQSIPAGLVHHGYKLIARGQERRFKSFGTWEKDGVRIALSQNILGVERGTVMVYQADEGEMTLEALITDPEARGQGKAKAALQLLTRIADETGTMVYLQPVQLEPSSGLNRSQLESLYASAGFNKIDPKGSVMSRQFKNPAGESSTQVMLDASPPSEPAPFDIWAAKTAVVDADGAPLVVFHATTADFTIFDPLRTSPSSRFGPGLYFTADIKTLDVYASSKLPEEGGIMMPVYLQIPNPQTDGVLSAEQVEAFFANVKVTKFPNGYDATADHARLKAKALEDLDVAFNTLLSGQGPFIDKEDWLRGMDAMGIDGIVREVFGHPEYVVFKPQQVKSAIGNNGQYDAANPDIRFSELEEAVSDADIATQAASPAKGRARMPFTVESDGDRTAVAKVGKRTVGRAHAWTDSNGHFVIMNSEVLDGYRRRGIASAMYKQIEDVTGRELRPAGSLSDDAFEFWKSYRPEAVALDLRHRPELIGRRALKNGRPGTITQASGSIAIMTYDGPEKTTTFFRRDQIDAHLLPEPEQHVVSDALDVPMFREDIPDEDWLQSQIDYAKEKGRDRFGAPYFGKLTGSYQGSQQMTLNVSDLVKLKGMRGEQENVRLDDLDSLMQVMSETGRLPLTERGEERLPFLQVAYNGEVWINEGNHRIMAAQKLGMKTLQVDIRYFDGGQRNAKGAFAPQNVNTVRRTDQPNTQAFKKWFGESKVVDADGQPQVMYHGTTQQFSQFKPGNGDLGMHFGTRDQANRRLEDRGVENAGQVMPVYLSITNPLRTRDAGDWNTQAAVCNLLADMMVEDDALAQAYEKALTTADPADGYRGVLQAMGYDGIVYANVGEETLDFGEEAGDDSWIAFSPDQIKSAIGNNGDFDPATDDIRFSATTRTDAATTIVTAFHGTPSEFKTFRASARGTFGSGFYFADEKAAACYAACPPEAGVFSPRIIKARLYFQNPLTVQADYAAGEALGLDSPAVPLLRRLFGADADAMIDAERSASDYEGFGPEVQAEAIAQGFDGLILSYPDRSMEYVVFNTRQIKRVGLNILHQPRAAPTALGVMSSFAGARATGAALSQRDVAQKRVRQGDDASLVRRETGWFMGMDSQWRFEIPDDTARLLPMLKNLRTGGFDARMIESVTYRPNSDGTMQMTLNPPNPRTLRDFVALDHLPPEILPSLVPPKLVAQMLAGAGREDYLGNFEDAKCIDHAFEFGGFEALQLDMVLDHPALFAAYPSLRNIYFRVDPKLGLSASLGITSNDEEVITVGPAYPLQNLLHELQHAIQNLEGFAEGGTLNKPADNQNLTALEIAAADHYHRLAGEVEARNTVARQPMTPVQRNLVSPAATQDVPSDRVITRANTHTPEARSQAMATPESVRAAVSKLFGPDYQSQTVNASQILVVNSGDVRNQPSHSYSYSLMQSMAVQNPSLSRLTLHLLANTVSQQKAQAFYQASSRSITMIADRIPAGQETSVLMHELTHKHGRDAMEQGAWQSLVDQVKSWRDADPASTERKIYYSALRRTANVKGLSKQSPIYDEELFAYAVESAISMGVKPSANAHPHSAEAWLAAVISSIERVGEKLTGKAQGPLSSQDVVDLAYALAQLETPHQAAAISKALLAVGLHSHGHSQVGHAEVLHSQSVQPLQWYSALSRAIDNSPMKVAPAKAWLDLLKNLPTKGVKSEEIHWSGVTDWLSQQPGQVSKNQVLDYLVVAGVQVQEIILGGDAQQYNEAVDRLTYAGFEITSDDYFGVELTKDGLAVTVEELSPEQRWDLELLDQGMESDDPLIHGSARYSAYQSPMARNYREMLFVMPPRTKTDYALSKRLTVHPHPDGFVIYKDDKCLVDQMHGHKIYATRDQALSAVARMVESPVPVYSAAHWPGGNVLAHVRLNERQDTNGERTLFVEEIQSDWGQRGKKEGFVNEATTIDGKTASQWQAVAQDTFGTWSTGNETALKNWHQAIDNAKVLRQKYEQMGFTAAVEIPSGPFVTATQKWLSLALKRIIGYAVENGFDQVALVNGEQLAKRFGLAQYITSVNWTVAPDGAFNLEIYKQAGKANSTEMPGPHFVRNVSRVNLKKFVGAELAKDILDTAAGSGHLDGLAAKSGGEGMRAFYDVITPNALRALLEKMGGNGLRQIEFEVDGDVTQQTGFAVTPSMREMAMQGMPLFSYALNGTNSEAEPEEGVADFCS